MSDSHQELPKFITVNELAEHLRISASSAYELCREEGFPAVRVGGIIRIPTAGLTRWLERQASSSASRSVFPSESEDDS